MKLSISNIAWMPEEDHAVADILCQSGIDAVDIAPGKYFADVARASTDDILAVRRAWSDRGISIVGMQLLLFGTHGFNVFGSESVQAKMLMYLAHVCRVAHFLGANFLVFGSPKNRDREGLSIDDASERACDFFRRLGDIAADHNVLICLEPNPVHYNCNFMVSAAETAAMVRRVGHSHIVLQLDTGALQMAEEDPATAICRDHKIISHIHLSEPFLKPLGSGGVHHESIARSVTEHLRGKTATIEMLAQGNGKNLTAIASAVAYAKALYDENGCRPS